MKKLLKWFLLIILLALTIIASEVYFHFASNIFNTFRYHTLVGGGVKCLDELKLYSNDFKSLGNLNEGSCKVKNAVRIFSYKSTKLSNKLTLSCPTALNVARYLDEIDAKSINHMGSYNCRKVSGSKIFSEHSYGTAIDISGIDGASLLKDWNKGSNKGQILKKAYITSCKYFSNIMTPDSNKAHKDHFHFDNGVGTKCYLK